MGPLSRTGGGRGKEAGPVRPVPDGRDEPPCPAPPRHPRTVRTGPDTADRRVRLRSGGRTVSAVTPSPRVTDRLATSHRPSETRTPGGGPARRRAPAPGQGGRPDEPFPRPTAHPPDEAGAPCEATRPTAATRAAPSGPMPWSRRSAPARTRPGPRSAPLDRRMETSGRCRTWLVGTRQAREVGVEDEGGGSRAAHGLRAARRRPFGRPARPMGHRNRTPAASARRWGASFGRDSGRDAAFPALRGPQPVCSTVFE